MILGAIDPMEGSVVVLPGSIVFALGTILGRAEREIIRFRLLVVAAITLGVATLWGFSMVGGFGGETGRSMWWGLLVLPYPVAWSAGVWGPGSPRWLSILGGIIGLWYLAVCGMIIARIGNGGPGSKAGAVVIVAVGAMTLTGCIYRLMRIDRIGR